MTKYTINETFTDGMGSRRLAEVDSIEEARAYLVREFTPHEWTLVGFDLDDEHDAADAALLNAAGTELMAVTVERA